MHVCELHVREGVFVGEDVLLGWVCAKRSKNSSA